MQKSATTRFFVECLVKDGDYKRYYCVESATLGEAMENADIFALQGYNPIISKRTIEND